MAAEVFVDWEVAAEIVGEVWGVAGAVTRFRNPESRTGAQRLLAAVFAIASDDTRRGILWRSRSGEGMSSVIRAQFVDALVWRFRDERAGCLARRRGVTVWGAIEAICDAAFSSLAM